MDLRTHRFALGLVALATAACSAPALAPSEPLGALSAPATATHRRLCVVVAPLTKDLAEAAFDDYVSDLDRPELAVGLAAFRPGWDGIEEPPPAPYLWFQCFEGTLADAGIWADAADEAFLYGLRRYEGRVMPDESSVPVNTLVSIYEGHTLLTDGYDPERPVDNYFAAMAAHVESGLVSGLFFPSCSFWGQECP